MVSQFVSECGSGGVQAKANREFLSYLDCQTRAATAQTACADFEGTTFFSAIDQDRPTTHVTHLMVLLEDCQGNEKLVDMTTNNDRFVFVVAVLKRHFENWRITESWDSDSPF